ncbi:MAG: PhnD/SsuA/transferrin family substrate-binding protein [Methylococcaceae bacterium]|nr:PhnD/SsuA/transferrin family substrate-binding protein [Methylococcaceae bacterium]
MIKPIINFFYTLRANVASSTEPQRHSQSSFIGKGDQLSCAIKTISPCFTIIILLWLFLLIPLSLQAKETANIKNLTFGVVPQYSALKLAMQWGPLLQEVSQRSGILLRFRTAPNIPEFEKRLSEGQYDLAYMNPYHYIVFHKTVAYQAFAKAKERCLQGIIIVKKDSPYQTLNELTARTLVFPSPAAFAATILTQAAFSAENININAIYVNSHDSVYRAVASGRYIAGGGIHRTFNAIDEALRKKLRILSTTQSYTPHPFAAHPSINKDIIEKLRAAFASLADDDMGRKLLLPLRLKGIIPAQDNEWDDVRALKINHLQHFNNMDSP